MSASRAIIMIEQLVQHTHTANWMGETEAKGKIQETKKMETSLWKHKKDPQMQRWTERRVRLGEDGAIGGRPTRWPTGIIDRWYLALQKGRGEQLWTTSILPGVGTRNIVFPQAHRSSPIADCESMRLLWMRIEPLLTGSPSATGKSI